MESQPSSITPSEESVSVGWSRKDIEVAKVAVRWLVLSGRRECISDLLCLPESAIEAWYEQDAIRYLNENARRRESNG